MRLICLRLARTPLTIYTSLRKVEDMPCGVYKFTDVPDDKLDELIAEIDLDPPLKIDQQKAANGTWTVTATYPPCPPGQPQSTTQQYGSS
jgi:hypothetical protein